MSAESPVEAIAHTDTESRPEHASNLIGADVYAEQVRLIYGGTKFIVGGSLVGIWAITAALFNAVSTPAILAWAIGMTAFLGVRYVTGRRFEAAAPGNEDIEKWSRVFLVQLVISALGWGCVGVFFIPEGKTAHQLYTVFVLTCIAAGALMSLSYICYMFVIFLAPFSITVPARLIIMDEHFTIVTGLSFLAMSVFLSGAARRINAAMKANITLKLENRLLADKATAETRRVEALAEDLSESKSVTERTLERVNRDLALAKTMQEAIFLHDFPDDPRFEISAFMRAARQVGGDFYDVFRFDDNRIGLVIGDVAGKGVASALFMAMSRELLGSIVHDHIAPARVMSEMNAKLCEQNPISLFVTLFYGVFDLASGKLVYSIGGHERPIKVGIDKSTKELNATPGMALGVYPNVEFGERTAFLNPGETLFLFTDGINEAFDKMDHMFGRSRLKSALAASVTHGPDKLIGDVIGHVERFVGEFEQSDDLTCLAFKYKNGGKALGNDHRAELKNDLNLISDTLAEFAAVYRRWGLSEKVQFELQVCLDEYLSNIISYGYKDTGVHTISTTASFDQSSVRLAIEDDGTPFDPRKAVPTSVADTVSEQKVGGQGIKLIRTYTDALNYDSVNGRNTFTMVKTIGS